MTEAHAKEAVTVGHDQPPALVDALGVEETGLLALDIDEAAVAIELWPVGCRILTGLRGSLGAPESICADCSMAVRQWFRV